MAEQSYDVLIIGSGASGGMAAYILTQKGANVLVLEAGVGLEARHRGLKPVYDLPYRGFGKPGRLPHVVQANEFNANQWVDEQQVPYTYAPDARYNWVRARLIGGKSNFWARMSYRLSDFEFKGKDHDGFGDNWPISHADLAPFYDRVEPIFRVSGRKEGVASLPDGQFLDDTSPDAGAAVKFAAAGKKHGMTLTKIRRSLGDGQLASSANLLLPEAQATGKLTLVPNAVVREITVDKKTGRVNGAHFVDKRFGPRAARQGQGGGARRLVPRVHAHPAQLEDRQFQRRARPLPARPVLHRRRGRGLGARGARRQRAARPGRRRRLHPALPQRRQGEKHKFLRGYAFDFYTGGTPDAKYFPPGAPSWREAGRLSRLGVLDHRDGRGPAALREPRHARSESRRRVGHPGAALQRASTPTTRS